MADHLDLRTTTFRRRVIPWMAAARSLSECRVLEIGCGTGASTVALAEQGCDLVGVDVNEGNILVAQERCRIYGLEAKFLCANATDLHEHYEPGAFDLIIFFATLEHLTYAERISAMRCTWEMLEPGSLWCVVDTPNRLWWFDWHTAHLPFFNWLPDDLALDYAPHSDRVFMQSYATAGRDDGGEARFCSARTRRQLSRIRSGDGPQCFARRRELTRATPASTQSRVSRAVAVLAIPEVRDVSTCPWTDDSPGFLPA